MFLLINILNCLPPLLCSVWSQAHMYEINYIDQQFFIVTKQQDKNSLNCPIGIGHSSLGLQIYFFTISEKAERIDYGDGRRVRGGGGGRRE